MRLEYATHETTTQLAVRTERNFSVLLLTQCRILRPRGVVVGMSIAQKPLSPSKRAVFFCFLLFIVHDRTTLSVKANFKIQFQPC